jgi:hypothetical protein
MPSLTTAAATIVTIETTTPVVTNQTNGRLIEL